jgi:hypothetical protein
VLRRFHHQASDGLPRHRLGMRFGSLDFIVTMVLPLPVMDLDTVIKTLEGLRLCPSESHVLEHGQFGSSSRKRSEHQPVTWGFFPRK